MDRVLRIIGVAIVVALPICAYWAFDRAVSAESTGGEPAPAASEDEPWPTDPPDSLPLGAGRPGSDADLDATGAPPRYLAFDPTEQAMAARNYRVGDLVGIRDRDIEPDAEPRDYPTETELAPGVSLAPVEFIDPGLYASSFEGEGCSYELRRIDRSGQDRLIGQEHLREGRLLVHIDPIEPDVFSSGPQCREWLPWSALAEPLIQVTVGDYWIGDLAPGVWAVPDGCLWEEVVSFRGARLADVTDSGRGPAPLVVDEDTLGLRLRDCDDPYRLIEAAMAPGIGLEPGLQP